MSSRLWIGVGQARLSDQVSVGCETTRQAVQQVFIIVSKLV